MKKNFFLQMEVLNYIESNYQPVQWLLTPV